MYYLVIVDAYGDIDVTSLSEKQYKEFEYLAPDELLTKMEDFLKLHFGVAVEDILWWGIQCKRPKFSTVRYKPVIV